MIRAVLDLARIARAALALVAVSLGVLVGAPAALAQGGVVTGQTPGGVQVVCLGAPQQYSNGDVAVCILARNMDFTNSYGVSPSGQGAGWSMSWPRCKAGAAVTFGKRGNVQTCTLWTNVSVTNSYGSWSFGFTCRKNAVITFDNEGRITTCTSAGNQAVNNAQCRINDVINIASGGAATCGGGGPTIPTALTGSWSMAFIYNGQSYPYRLDLTQMGRDLTGSGNYPAQGQPSFAWTLRGSVDGDAMQFTAHYTLGATATMQVSGKIAPNGTMQGSWSDDYSGGRQGTWTARRLIGR
jgi:hypothetical protein